MKMRLQVIIMLLSMAIILEGCAAAKINFTGPPLMVRPYSVHKISLREHQVKPVEYLSAHEEQKGLLLNHYLGTGKTFTALAFAEKYPSKQVIILAPRFLESNWMSHIEKMGIMNRKRYQFISYESAAEVLLKKDLRDVILIVDEVHRLIERIKSKDEKVREQFSKIYFQLRDAHKILALTGTPVFTEISDVAYLINLVSGQDILPYNDRHFMDEFTQVQKVRSIWRGHFTESHVMLLGVPFVLASIPLAFIVPSTVVGAGVYFGGLAAGFAILPAVNAITPIEKNPMRLFEPGRIRELAMEYVSFYDFREDNPEDYPVQKFNKRSVNYNEEQASFMTQFSDLALNNDQLGRLTAEQSYNMNGDLRIESTPIQARLRDWPDSGREIGNLAFFKEDGRVVEPPKFEEIFKIMSNNPEGVVIYSSYFENGGQAFAQFLDRRNMRDKYKVLSPNLPVVEQTEIVNQYNRGDLPILILHPVYTEGISLEGTQQLHILEPLPSQALNEQIIGRVIRFQSHMRLPKEKRYVEVYNWKATLGFALGFLERNQNWAQRFSELSSISAFGLGQSRIDANFDRKRMSPDDFTDIKRESLKTAMQALEAVLREHCIERNIRIKLDEN